MNANAAVKDLGAPARKPILARSMLYVPVIVPKFVEKAHTRGADAIILDLEDSIALARKAEARSRFADAAAYLTEKGVDQIFVRINQPLRLAIPDLEAVISPTTLGLVFPKAQSAGHIQMVSEAIAELEAERGIPVGHTRLAVRIETASGFLQLNEIAAADPRIAFFGIGVEDFSFSLGVEPETDVLLMPKQMAVIAARAAGVSPHGLVGSGTGLSDLDRMKNTVHQSRRFGFEGAPCIHPAHVPILNEGFGVKPEEVDRARRMIDAYDVALAKGSGSIDFEGRMVDYPIVYRAERVVNWHEAIVERERRVEQARQS